MKENYIFESKGELIFNDSSGKEDELREGEEDLRYSSYFQSSIKEVRELKNSKN